MYMISAALLLLAHSLLFSLRLDANAGSFPKPLTAAEERDCLHRMAEGDLEARNTLIEHNLRLAGAHCKERRKQKEDFSR